MLKVRSTRIMENDLASGGRVGDANWGERAAGAGCHKTANAQLNCGPRFRTALLGWAYNCWRTEPSFQILF